MLELSHHEHFWELSSPMMIIGISVIDAVFFSGGGSTSIPVF